MESMGSKRAVVLLHGMFGRAEPIILVVTVFISS